MSRRSHRGGRSGSGTRAVGARPVAHRVLSGWAEGRVQRVGAALDTAWAAASGQGIRLDPSRKAAERALAQELVLGCVRQQILLDRVLGQWLHKGLPKQPDALAALRMGAYQLLFAERVPAHAAVDTAVALAGRQRSLVNAVLRRLADALRHGPVEDHPAERVLALREGVWVALPEQGDGVSGLPPLDTPAGLAARWSLPEWLVERWTKAHGRAAAAALAAASVATPGLHLRPVGCSLADLVEALAAEGVWTQPVEDLALLRWTGGSAPFRSGPYVEGRFAVQDPTPLRAVQALGVSPGERVLDMCAAPGTKAMVLAEAVGEDGGVYAHDPDPDRGALLPGEAARLGLADRIHPVGDPVDHSPYDAVLVDAPCSNTGVLARRVEVRHRITAEEIRRLATMQRGILGRALKLVRPGGRLVYTTCSIEPEENQEVVAGVLRQLPGRLLREETVLPDPPLRDGGYFAVVEATGGG